jgi:hypothetical protein
VFLAEAKTGIAGPRNSAQRQTIRGRWAGNPP